MSITTFLIIYAVGVLINAFVAASIWDDLMEERQLEKVRLAVLLFLVLASFATWIYATIYVVFSRIKSFIIRKKEVKPLKAKENVEFVLDSVATELLGEDMINGIRVKNVKTDETRDLTVKGVFIAIGQMPDNQIFSDIVKLDNQGYIIADESCETGTEGVYAAGDCRTKSVRQLTTAAADGAVAALAAAKLA